MRSMPGAEIELPRMDALLEVGTSFNRLVARYQANSDYREEERILQNLMYMLRATRRKSEAESVSRRVGSVFEAARGGGANVTEKLESNDENR